MAAIEPIGSNSMLTLALIPIGLAVGVAAEAVATRRSLQTKCEAEY